MALPTLFLGSGGEAVRTLVARLRAQGFWTPLETPTRVIEELELSVRDFQRTHLGPDGSFLEVDGVVGSKTWWALEHPSGPAQHSGLRAEIPARLSSLRTRVLQTALDEHRKRVAEVPDGSNRGPEVDKYLPRWMRSGHAPGPPWCCFFYSWVVREALGAWPLGAQEGSCTHARRRAGELSLWKPKSLPGSEPVPGDAFVMDRGGGRGHIGFVLRVSADGRHINSVEGNCGNRVKLGLRALSDPEIVGFIDNVQQEQARDFERGIVSAEPVAGDTRV